MDLGYRVLPPSHAVPIATRHLVRVLENATPALSPRSE
jgi:hypothetical protein